MNTFYESPATILYLKGDINYTELYLTNGKKLVTCRTLLRYQEHFLGFVRISRKHLLNPEYILKICNNAGDHEVIMSDGYRIKVPRRQIKTLKMIS